MQLENSLETVTSDDPAAGAGPAGEPVAVADTKITAGSKTGNNRPDTRFPRGISGNPRGRPAGTRNRATLLREARLAERIDRQLDGMLDALVAKALSGHVGAIRTALALSLSADRLEPQEADKDEEAVGADAAPLPVLSAKNSSRPEPQPEPEPEPAPEPVDERIAVLSARIQPALPAAAAVRRAFTLDAPPDTGVAALQAFLARLGVPVGPEDHLSCGGTAQLPGLIAVEPELSLVREPRSYLVAAPTGTAMPVMEALLLSLGVDLGPDDRILRAGHAPLPMLVMATPPLRMVAEAEGSPP